MKTNIFFLAGTLLSTVPALCQDQLAGFKTSNYSGVESVFANPANIADSRYKWDVSLLSIGASVQNNVTTLTFKSIGRTNIDSIIGNSPNKVNANALISVLGPSFMFNINSKTTLAFSSNVKVMVNINNLDGRLIQNINNNTGNESYPYNIASGTNQTIAINGWREFGFSLGQVLVSNRRHFLKAGITLKYLGGIANTYVNIGSLNATVNADASNNAYMQTGSAGNLAIGEGGISVDSFKAKELTKANGSGFGGDIGFVYEYRPNSSLYAKGGANKYKLRISLALLEVGSINYTANPAYTAGYNLSVVSSPGFYFNNLNGKNISQIKSYLDGDPNFKNTGSGTGSYAVSLPSNMQLGVDYHVQKGFYVNLNGQISLQGAANFKNPSYSNSVTLTPRYEGSSLGIFVPVNYNSVSHFNAGVAFKLGPLFIGSGSVITTLLGSGKQADVYFGLQFGGLK